MIEKALNKAQKLIDKPAYALIAWCASVGLVIVIAIAITVFTNNKNPEMEDNAISSNSSNQEVSDPAPSRASVIEIK